MSQSFAFSVNAEPFVPQSDENSDHNKVLQLKIQTLQSELEDEMAKNKRIKELYVKSCSQRSEISEENSRLNSEIRSINKKLLEERVDKRELSKKIHQQEIIINNFKKDLRLEYEKCNNFSREYSDLQLRFDNLNREFTQYKETNNSEVWIERCLKLDFIFKKMKQIGALSEDHGAWVWDMVEDIEFPENSTDSVFLELPNSIRNRYLPSFDDAGIEFSSGESSIINELSREAEEFNMNLSENFRRNLDENPEIVMNHIRMIQSRFREYLRPNKEAMEKAAVKIQAVWRGFCGRGIITYKGRLHEWYENCKILLDEPKTFSHKSTNIQVNIIFTNTSDKTIHYQWIKIRNTDRPVLEGQKGRMYNVRPGKSINVKAFYGHWFRTWEQDKQDSFFRITKSSFLGNLNIERRPVFDLNTKITLTNDDFVHWITLKNVLSRLISDRDTHEDDDEDDDARLRLAIQLSLEQTRSLTDDVIDFNIDNLYR
jgi:hypothetical protein